MKKNMAATDFGTLGEVPTASIVQIARLEGGES